VKEVIAIFVLISVIYAGMEGVSRIAARESVRQIDQHSFITETKSADRYNRIMLDQAAIKIDVAVTMEQVHTIGEDVKEIKEILKDK
jgi:hypothetical protein